MTGLIANVLLVKTEGYPEQFSEDIILQSVYSILEIKSGEVEKEDLDKKNKRQYTKICVGSFVL